MYEEPVYTDAEIRLGIPHKYKFPWYEWAWEFKETRNKVALLCAGNQISKSSTQIRVAIEWATEKKLWPQLWPNLTPNLFWYLYPSQKVVNEQFLTKWMQFLPAGRFKNHPKYGWKALKKNDDYIGIQFFSGILLLFKTYSQKSTDLQAGSVFAMFCDEELPMKHWSELQARMTATDGYFRMVFTATIGQEFWRLAMEPGPDDPEMLPGAWKREISLYDAMTYMDGSPGWFTEERIQAVIANCETHDEEQRRVHGRFILALADRKYPKFDAKRHYTPVHKIPSDWLWVVGSDPGSGGTAHPAGLAFTAVAPDYSCGRLVKSWAGEDCGNTTAGDVLQKYLDLRFELEETYGHCAPDRKFYDQACKDFLTLSQRAADAGNPWAGGWEQSEKNHEIGDQIVNQLFEQNMILVFDTPENRKFGTEISAIKKSVPKTKRKDDRTDAARYSWTKLLWAFGKMDRGSQTEIVKILKEETYAEECARVRTERARRHFADEPDPTPDFTRASEGDLEQAYAAELEEYAELYDC